MPHLEAPTSLTTDSSTERSLSPDILREPVNELLISQEATPQRRAGVRLPPLLVDESPAVHLLPVNLPQETEPTLPVLLQRVTGRNDFENVEAVHLRVISYSISLSQLALYLPRLQQLDLSGSVLNSLRDLGLGLVHLSYLNISNCGLSSLDGIGGTPALRILVSDGNMCQRVDPLVELALLQKLSMLNNRISDLGLLTFLGMCPNLSELNLQGNPVCHSARYRLTMQRCVPTLQLLDEQTVTAEIPPASPSRNSMSADSEFSSLSSSSEIPSLSLTSSEHTSLHSGRPHSKDVVAIGWRSPTDSSIRAQTSLPFVANLVSRARQQRRQAWTSSSNSSLSS